MGKEQKEPSYACRVVITCEQPDEEGFMQVYMDHEGDIELAAYLLRNAQSLLENREQWSDEAD